MACVKLKEVQPNCRQSKTLLPLIAIALIFVKVNVCRHCILVFIEGQTPTLYWRTIGANQRRHIGKLSWRVATTEKVA